MCRAVLLIEKEVSIANTAVHAGVGDVQSYLKEKQKELLSGWFKQLASAIK
jgi:hypothetical protein